MDRLVELLERKLRQWPQETSAEVRKRVVGIIESADRDDLALSRSRAIKHEVLKLIDESPEPRPKFGSARGLIEIADDFDEPL